MKKTGYTLVEILIVAVVTLLISALAYAVYQNAAADQLGRTCSANLRTIEAAKTAWAHDHPGQEIASPNDLVPYLKTGLMPACPSGGVYSNVTDRRKLTSCSLYDSTKPWAHSVNQ